MANTVEKTSDSPPQKNWVITLHVIQQATLLLLGEGDWSDLSIGAYDVNRQQLPCVGSREESFCNPDCREQWGRQHYIRPVGRKVVIVPGKAGSFLDELRDARPTKEAIDEKVSRFLTDLETAQRRIANR